MIIDQLSLKHFRNYDNLSITCNPKLNIFVGQNAQGKTNAVEAIYALALTRSHRTNQDREMIAWGADELAIQAQISKRYGTVPLSFQLSKKGRIVKVNNLKEQRLADYIGNLTVVMFAPEDLTLIKGAPSLRRRFMDLTIGQITPLYLQDLLHYNKVLKERNHYLKQDQNRIDLTFLDVLDEQLVSYGSKIMVQRQDFITDIDRLAQPIHQKLSNDREQLSIRYLPNVRDDFFELIKQARQKDLARRQTTVGPHRDDLDFMVNDINVGDFGSQGQQRTTILSLKLAEIDHMANKTNDFPILILDDVMSELDNERQLALLNAVLDKTQTFITTTSLEHLKHLPQDLNIFQVETGKIQLKNAID